VYWSPGTRCRCRLWDTCSQYLGARKGVANRAVIATGGIDIGADRRAGGNARNAFMFARSSPVVSVWNVHVCVIGSGRKLDFVAGLRRRGSGFKLLNGESSLDFEAGLSEAINGFPPPNTKKRIQRDSATSNIILGAWHVVLLRPGIGCDVIVKDRAKRHVINIASTSDIQVTVNNSRGVATCQLRKVGLISVRVGYGVIFPGVRLAAVHSGCVITADKINLAIIGTITGSHKRAHIGQDCACAPRIGGDIINLVQIVDCRGVRVRAAKHVDLVCRWIINSGSHGRGDRYGRQGRPRVSTWVVTDELGHETGKN